MGLAHVIGPDAREWFRRCRRAWDFGSPNRRNLAPIDHARPGLTHAVRKALAVWYFPGMWEWPRAIVQPRALQAYDEGIAAGRASPDDVERARAMLERYIAWAPTVDAFTPVRIEADFEAGIPDPRSPGNELIDAAGRPVRYHDRIHVLLVDATDAYWVMEHRLVFEEWAAEEELLLAERPVAAAWGWEHFYLGMEFAGTVHNELRVTAASTPDAVLGVDSPPARRPRSRDFARSRAAGRSPERGSAPGGDEPAGIRVESGGEWFRRTWIRRTRAEISAVAGHLSGVAAEMLDPSLDLYPSPAPEHCRRCDYRRPCIALNEGADVEAVLAEGYRHRPEAGPEEGRLGGGSWSMNRGAAPPPQWRTPPR